MYRKQRKREPTSLGRTNPGQQRSTSLNSSLFETPPQPKMLLTPPDEHSRLATLLRAKHPEANIHTRSILLGIAGTIYEQYTISQLHQLGVRGTLLKSTITKMQRIAIQDLHATWRTRQATLQRPQGQDKGNQPPPACGTKGPHPVGRPHFPPTREGDSRDVGGGPG
jgi:hypothetical protein